jgi:hypothetical protein
MAKTEIVPNKIIIDFDKHGNYQSGVIQYRTKTDGHYSQKYKTISIEGSGHSIPVLNAMLVQFRNHARKAEGASDAE